MPDDKLARALGSRVRRDMLHALIEHERSVHEVAALFKLTEVTASKHLKKLFDLGLLTTRTEGRERFYSLGVTGIEGLIREFDRVAEQMGGQ